MDIKNIKLVLLLTVLYVSLPSLSWTEESCRSVFNEITEKLKKLDINQYKGWEGYVRFVEELEGTKRMDYVFHEISKVLGPAKMKGLQWQQFLGTSEDFKNLKELLSLDVIEKHKGMKGYANFAEKYFEGDMEKAYKNVSAVLGGGSRLMKQLDWQAYHGQVSDFNKLREKVLKEDGSIKEEYKGSAGYVLFAEKYFEADMLKAYINVSAVLGGASSLMKQLDWQGYHGQVSDFNKLGDKILKEDGSIREEYKGSDGYALFAEKYFEGDMEKAYKNVSAVLGGGSRLMKQLDWQGYKGQVSDFNKLREKILKEDGSIREEYKGSDGYALFAEKYFEGDMEKAYKNVSAVLGGGSRLMKQLDWQGYKGQVSDFNKLREKILNEDGSIREEYKGSAGYVLFAEKYFEGDMQKAYINVSAVLGGGSRLMKQLDWQSYHGQVSDFNKLGDKILKEDGSIKEEYKGRDGYALFAEKYFEGNMEKAYINVSAVLGGGSRLMKQLAWQEYQGQVSDFNKLRDKILNKDGSIREEYKGSDGYVLFAEKYFEGDMKKAYLNVSAVLGGGSRLMKQLDWQGYQGQVSDFNKLREKILNEDGSVREEYKGSDGYALFAEKYFEGDMLKAYPNVSAVLGGSSRLMKQLDWQSYHGQVSDFNKLREKILNEDGSIREEYKGSDGYVKFAEEYFEGDMLKAYKNVSAVLGGGSRLMKQLDWQAYHGQASGFNELREKILNEDGSIREEYKGSDGYASFAKKYFEGNMQKAYQNVSSVLGGGSRLMKQLDWQQYQGQVSGFNKIRDKILNEDGSIREEYKGSDGYASFAKKYFEGNMQKAYQNVSAVLGGVLEMRRLKLDWKSFQGTVDQFKDLKKLFESIEREELKGEKGQLRVAREIFKGNKIKAYGMVSALREELLGRAEAFDELDWRK